MSISINSDSALIVGGPRTYFLRSSVKASGLEDESPAPTPPRAYAATPHGGHGLSTRLDFTSLSSCVPVNLSAPQAIEQYYKYLRAGLTVD